MVETFRTKRELRREPADPASLERAVRQLLANKVSGNLVGLWLLVPEHLRLGTWDLLCGWTQQQATEVQPRLALQLVHEAALCATGLRQQRSLSQKGFELLNGLPFVASDVAMHELLDAHTVAQAEALQIQLGMLRRARGHYQGKLLAIDPHRLHSYTKRQTCRYRGASATRPYKVAQTFFCLDADTHQPVCFTSGTAAVSAAQATPPLMKLAATILNAAPGQTLVLLDSEHYTTEIVDRCKTETPFDLLVPMDDTKLLQKFMAELPAELFTPRWAGFATARLPYQIKGSHSGPQQLYVQRSGETPADWEYKGFLSTRRGDEVDDLTRAFPQRWHIEEFFNAHQHLGWQRAGTLNLNIRYGQMTMALLAQAALYQLRERLGPPCKDWDAQHLAQSLFRGIDGDIRVADDTIVVTLYNAPRAEQMRTHYQALPDKLAAEQVDPRIPWLYGYKLDFRFR